MRRMLGIALAVVSAVTAVVLLMAGQFASMRLTHVGGGGTPTSRWDVVAFAFDVNWLLAVPVAVCFVAGLVIGILPRRR